MRGGKPQSNPAPPRPPLIIIKSHLSRRRVPGAGIGGCRPQCGRKESCRSKFRPHCGRNAMLGCFGPVGRVCGFFNCPAIKARVLTNRVTQAGSQWIVAQRPLSHLQFLGATKSSAKDLPLPGLEITRDSTCLSRRCEIVRTGAEAYVAACRSGSDE